MRLTIVCAALVVAYLLSSAKNPVERSDSSFSPAPPAEVLLVLSLGRTDVAADVAWLGVVQRIGSRRYAAEGFPGLENWLDLTTALSPRFELAYYVGAAFLAADAGRADALDRLLERGERALPNSFYIPMSRGFVHYFGRYEPAVAARHYRRAAALPEAPEYLGRFADRLEKVAGSCRELNALLRDMQNDTAGMLADQRSREILVTCLERALERASASYRLSNGREPTLDQLVALGMVPDLIAPPGECWRLESGVATLEPCQ